MEKNIVTINAPIDPDSMGDDGPVAPIRMTTGPAQADPSRIVTDPTADPRGVGFADPGSDALAAATGVQQLRKQPSVALPASEEDEGLAAFVRDLGVDPATVGLAAEAPTAQARPTAAAAPAGDMLEIARKRALAVLGALPRGTELFVGGGALDESAVQLVMGIGFLIGKGAAVYRGNGHYCLSDAGRKLKG